MVEEIGVRVRFMGDLRAVVQSADLKLSLPKGTRVSELLKLLAATYGDPFAKMRPTALAFGVSPCIRRRE